jgi:hypothetical protein
MQDLTDFGWKVEKSKKSTFSHKSVKLVESCINGWTDLGVDLSELIAAHLIYMNPKFHGHSVYIQCDISLLLKSTENFKSRAMAILVIYGKNHNDWEIKSKWLHMINSRLTNDKIAALKIKTKQRVYQACGKHLGKSPGQREWPPKQLDYYAWGFSG